MFKKLIAWFKDSFNKEPSLIEITPAVKANMVTWQEWVGDHQHVQPHSIRVKRSGYALHNGETTEVGVTFNDPPSNKSELDEIFPLKDSNLL